MFKSLNPELNFFGLDISDSSLKFAKIDKRGGQFKVSAAGKRSLNPGIVKKGKVEDEDLLASKIRGLVRGYLDTPYVATSLPEERSFFQIIEIPKVKSSKLKNVIEYEAEDFIPLSVNETYLDFQIISEKRESLQVLISALPKKIIDPHVSALKKAGLFPVVAEIESISTVRSLVADRKGCGPLLLIDIGDEKTILTILSKGVIIFSSYLLVSSRDFTQRIAKEKNISFKEADKLKIGYGINSDQKPEIAKILLPFLEETVESIQKHIDYYNSCGFTPQTGKNPDPIESVLLCGGGANLNGLPDFLSGKLGIEVKKADPFVNLSETSREMIDGDGLRYGTAFGLALRNFKKDRLF